MLYTIFTFSSTLQGLMDFIFLFGKHRFAAHWLFWQTHLKIFSDVNPSGSFIYSTFYMRVLLTMIIAGITTALKRLWIATYLGKRSYIHFGPELEVILGKMLLVSSVANLGQQIESNIVTNKIDDGYVFASITKSVKAFPGLTTDSEDDSPIMRERKSHTASATSEGDGGGFGFGKSLLESGVVKGSTQNREKVKYTSSKQLEIMSLLEEWEVSTSFAYRAHGS